MNQERLMQVLVSPHVSEKATMLGDSNNEQVFKVLRDATKDEIKKAVEVLFEVKVAAVRVANMKGKSKRFGAFTGRRDGWKKAYVRLAPGSEINLGGAQ
ncbi:MAG: 50S ribosomal protein L23 [Chromatiales bacterium]|jgi:large subunit ribosomal protein L23|nr:50S ribosomal protein L23 [Chromatiales bacterium]MDX9765895.1 50S ribosomal protein L23 [Ectothiorhodospiraceae bacterium]